MARSRNKNNRVYSSISDDQLAMIIAQDYKNRPGDFIMCRTDSDILNTDSFLHNTSARGIEPMKKWL